MLLLDVGDFRFKYFIFKEINKNIFLLPSFFLKYAWHSFLSSNIFWAKMIHMCDIWYSYQSGQNLIQSAQFTGELDQEID